MATRTPIQLAIIGCGAVVERLYVPVLQRMEGIHVSALVDNRVERLEALSGRFPRAALCQVLDEMPSSIDAALVAVPHALHATVSIALLRKGIHVLCEKPMATCAADCLQMIEASRQSNAQLIVGHQKRFVPSIVKARELLSAGFIGRVHGFSGSMGMPSSSWQSCSGYQDDPKLAGGGVLLDSGIHLFDIVCWLMGDAAVERCILVPGVLEQEARVELSTPQGHGLLRFSRLRSLQNRFRVEGEEGFLEFDTYDYPLLKVFSAKSATCRHIGTVALTWPVVSPYQLQLEHFIQVVRGETGDLVNPPEQSMRAVRLAERAYAHAAAELTHA